MKKIGDSVRDFVNEWTINILILLFGTTTLVQAFIVPTPSMDTTVRVGDHLLVDKLAYAPPGSVTRYFLPYTEPKRGDIIVLFSAGPSIYSNRITSSSAADGRARRPYQGGR